jgi:hypothetical protein
MIIAAQTYGAEGAYVYYVCERLLVHAAYNLGGGAPMALATLGGEAGRGPNPWNSTQLT